MIKNSIKILILVVEDEKILVQTLEEKLTSDGFDVIKAYDGVEGLKIAMEKHPDLILLDLLMPKMDGMTFLKELRRNGDWGKKVPVIILTNLSADDEDRNKEMISLEPAFYVVKTEKSIDEIKEKIKERLNLN